MSVAFIWTTTNLPASRLIRWGLDEPVSHFAIVKPMRLPNSGIVLHQGFGGFGIDWFPAWRKKNKIVYALTPAAQMTRQDWNLDRSQILERYAGTEYDYNAIYYFGYRALLRKLFQIPLPKENLWSDDDEPLCTGVATLLHERHPEWFSRSPKDFDMVSPFMLYDIMLKSGMFVPWNEAEAMEGRTQLAKDYTF